MAAGTRLQRKAGIEDCPDQHAAETVDIMQALGVEFIGPMEQPPFRTPRFYNALPRGRAYIARLLERCRVLGVEVRTDRAVKDLLLEGGRVRGATVAAVQSERYLARRAVILASGDFSASEALRREYLERPLAGVRAFVPTSTGDGHRMGIAAGAALVRQPELSVAALLQACFAAHAGADAHHARRD